MQFDNYIIRALTTADLQPYFEMVEKNRSRLEQFFTGTVSRTQTMEDTCLFLKEITERAAEKTYMPFVIIEKNTGKFTGFIDLKNIDWSIPKTEMGCYMDESFAGKGLASKAFAVFCDYCFATLGFEKLFLRTHISNNAAKKLAEKNGFTVEGILRNDYKTTSGELIDLLYYGRLK